MNKKENNNVDPNKDVLSTADIITNIFNKRKAKKYRFYDNYIKKIISAHDDYYIEFVNVEELRGIHTQSNINAKYTHVFYKIFDTIKNLNIELEDVLIFRLYRFSDNIDNKVHIFDPKDMYGLYIETEGNDNIYYLNPAVSEFEDWQEDKIEYGAIYPKENIAFTYCIKRNARKFELKVYRINNRGKLIQIKEDDLNFTEKHPIFQVLQLLRQFE